MFKKLLLISLILFIPTKSFGAIDADTVWEMRVTGNNDNGGGFVWDDLTSTTYRWTASGSGTNEYYCQTAAGGNPSLTEPNIVCTGGNFIGDSNGTLGSLTVGQWDWGDNDALGYSTVYVRLDDGVDPDTKHDQFVTMGKGGGTDYTMQDTAQLTLTDLACAEASATTLTSVTGGFTALMVGNIVYIKSGTNFTAGYYEITGYTNGNTVTIDRDPTDGDGGDGSSGTGSIGGAKASPIDAFWEANIGRNITFIKSGVYTLTENISVDNDNLIILGYNSIRMDNPNGINRPTILSGAYTFFFDNSHNIKNLFITGTGSTVFDIDDSGKIENIKSINTSSTISRNCIDIGSSLAVKNETISNVGFGIKYSTQAFLFGNYCHGGEAGFNDAGNSSGIFILGNIISGMTYYGIAFGNSGRGILIGNTLYGKQGGISVGEGISYGNEWNCVVLNNIISGWVIACSDAYYNVDSLHGYNCWYNNTTEAYYMYMSTDVFSDPLFVNPDGTLIEDCEDAWGEYTGTGVTSTADGASKVGTNSAKAACDNSTGIEVVYTEAISSTNMSTYNGICCWVYSSVALNAGDWQLLLDDSANCGSPILTLSLPAMSAYTWYWIYLDGGDMSTATAIISIGLKQAVDKGAMSFYIDNVRASDCDFTLQSGSPCLDAGMQPSTNEGLTGDYKWNIGADQDDVTAAGSDSPIGWVAIQ